MLMPRARRVLGVAATIWVVLAASGCTTYRTAKELKLVGFEEDVSKGKSVGEVEGGDCVFHVMGYYLGGMPTLSRAFKNASMQRTSSVSDAFGGSNATGDRLRYMNNAVVRNDGFDVVIFGKKCILVSGLGFK